MTATPERRIAPRKTLSGPIEVVIDGMSYSAELANISTSGVQAKLNAAAALAGADCLEAVQLSDGTTLAVKVVWGLFDGTFGAAFVDQDHAEAQVNKLLNS